MNVGYDGPVGQMKYPRDHSIISRLLKQHKYDTRQDRIDTCSPCGVNMQTIYILNSLILKVRQNIGGNHRDMRLKKKQLKTAIIEYDRPEKTELQRD